MKYNEIKLSADETHFLYENERLFGKNFLHTLKFHSEGLAAVCDETGWYHLDLQGNALYEKRYSRAFGFYFERAAVTDSKNCYHIDIQGNRTYLENYAWCGNYQEKICTVRNFQNEYFHIDINGKPIYAEKYRYAGDFKDGFACVRLENGFFKHIDAQGKYLNDKQFRDLGIFHKGIATAKEEKGWFHCDKAGNELYVQRYAQIEVFYNGFALVQNFDNQKLIINESGEIILHLG
jgi:hypothetical protein